MSVRIRLAASAVAAVSVLSVAGAGVASAWPIPVTPEQQRFINQARNAGFPGDDDAVLQAGRATRASARAPGPARAWWRLASASSWSAASVWCSGGAKSAAQI